MSRLPPFFALRALEAAARHRSYSRAAAELAVTHGAVSHHMRRLEAELGARLFERRGNLMLPTPEAERLAGEVRRGLDVLREGVAAFGEAAERDPLVVSLCVQFASRWLPPRLPGLLADPAGANLEMRVEDRVADFLTDGVDVAVRYGAGGWSGVESEQLLGEVLFPVCSPTVAARHPVRRSQDLLGAPLLHHAHRPWALWFEAFDLAAPPQTGMLFEDSLMLYEAAAQGLGVALARSGLVEGDLESGRLVRPLSSEVATDQGFHLVWRADSRKLARIEALRDWLAAEAAPGVAERATRAA
ncbi:MAG: LysR family transcriptional regulator [Phenylobacterium sp.]|nr:MAG: LysR family transcriptional regulator [Phenylobacterium sp.]